METNGLEGKIFQLEPVVPAVECRRQPGEKKYEPKLLTAAQVASLVQSFPLLERTLVLVVAATGLRMSEALGLQWQDVDIAGSRIYVRRTWCHGAVGAPKTESSGKPVPMHTILAEVVELWHRETPYSEPTDWVFASAKLKGMQPREGCQLVKDYLRPAAVKLGILSADDNSRFGLHNLRHSLATAMVASGEDVKTVQGILRHAHCKTTLDFYAHSVETVKVAAQGRYLQDWNTTLIGERAPLQLPAPAHFHALAAQRTCWRVTGPGGGNRRGGGVQRGIQQQSVELTTRARILRPYSGCFRAA